HLVGGCPMSASPETGVVDSDQRSWSVPNLFVADGSVMATQSAANPALTIMALSSRLAELLSAKRTDADAAGRRATARGRRRGARDSARRSPKAADAGRTAPPAGWKNFRTDV